MKIRLFFASLLSVSLAAIVQLSPEDEKGDKKEIIRKGMDHYEFYTCIRFVPRTNEDNYLKIFKGSGCYSFVGKGKIKPGIGQPLSLGSGCHHVGTIVHELGHAIGFYHEQSRSDRDDYLIIYFENIMKSNLNDFKKLKPHENILYNSFDYDSIMIYGNKIFTTNGKDTMVARNGKKLLGPYNKFGMSIADTERVNKMYNCTLPPLS
nr:astacin-like metalloprotease toxin 4 isoform X2 [Parasteatoda tepidariorum]